VEMETEAMECAPMDSVAPSTVGVVQRQSIVVVARLVPAEMETEVMEFAPMDSAAPSTVGVVQLRPIAVVALPLVPAETETEATEFAPMDSVAPVTVGVVQLRPIVLLAIFAVGKRRKSRLRMPRKRWIMKVKSSHQQQRLKESSSLNRSRRWT
jgi:hypothetical protein